VSIRTELQERVDGSWMALMMSLTESIIQGVPAGGILLGGALTAAFGPRAAIAVGGLGALVTAGAVWVSLQRGSAAVLPGPRGADESSVDTSKPAPVTS
jgi:hypothetical protein